MELNVNLPTQVVAFARATAPESVLIAKLVFTKQHQSRELDSPGHLQTLVLKFLHEALQGVLLGIVPHHNLRSTFAHVP